MNKAYCEYCHGTTIDDSIGHCAGCGAPRSQLLAHGDYSNLPGSFVSPVITFNTSHLSMLCSTAGSFDENALLFRTLREYGV